MRGREKERHLSGINQSRVQLVLKSPRFGAGICGDFLNQMEIQLVTDKNSFFFFDIIINSFPSSELMSLFLFPWVVEEDEDHCSSIVSEIPMDPREKNLNYIYSPRLQMTQNGCKLL